MKPRREILNGARIQEIKQKKKRILHIKLYLALFLFVSLIVGAVFLSRNPKINIDKINISGNAAIATEDIMAVVNDKLSGYYLFVFPKTDIFLYPKSKIEESILQKFQRIYSAKIKIDNLKEITITVAEREGKYLWCSAPGEKGENCYFIDKGGFAFDLAPTFSGLAYFKFYGDLEAERDPTGQYFTEELEFQRLVKFYDALRTVVAPMKLSALSAEVNEDYKFSIEGTEGKIIFKKENDYEMLLGNLDSAIHVDPLKTDLVDKLKSLLYIDLRFDNKVYFKFQ